MFDGSFFFELIAIISLNEHIAIVNKLSYRVVTTKTHRKQELQILLSSFDS